jgi:hypothetical protein
MLDGKNRQTETLSIYQALETELDTVESLELTGNFKGPT